ncbi:MAG: hypothetical protein HZB81_00570 [Deltaproteobacteria bacterium]|nr:hypothetical protein [Deltaproteobacteria bacterium]
MSKNSLVFIGIDIGSVSANTVVVDENRNIIEEHYTRTKGQPLETTLAVLSDVLARFPADNIKAAAITGSAGKLIAPLIG